MSIGLLVAFGPMLSALLAIFLMNLPTLDSAFDPI
jgi:hypothetical protein